MAIIIPRRRRRTWEGETVATWCGKWMCTMWRGLGPHTLIFLASLSLPPMRGAGTGCTPTIFQNDSFYTRISNFVQSPILSAASIQVKLHCYCVCILFFTFFWTLQPELGQTWDCTNIMSNQLEASRQTTTNVNNKNKACKLLWLLRRNAPIKKRWKKKKQQ